MIVKRLRERCAAAFASPVDYPFSRVNYREGETPDAALYRIFETERRASGSGWTDEDVMDSLIYG